MRIYIETEKLTNDNLRAIANSSGKSVRTIKRMKKSYTYLGYSTANGCFRFFPYSIYLSTSVRYSSKRFFETIEQEALLGLLK